MFRPIVASRFWRLSSAPSAGAFRRAARRPREAQERLLLRLLHANRHAAYGARYGFDRVSGVDGFRERVPTVTYEDLVGYIDEIARGRQGVLTAEPVRLLQPTSGSTTGPKLIPYTRSLGAEYQRAVSVWIDDLFSRIPALSRGTAYWSVSPAVSETRTTDSGIRVGFEDDAEYLGRWSGALVRAMLAVDPEVRRVRTIDGFRYVTLHGLLTAADLRLISVWHPTFLTLLLEPLAAWWDRLLEDIRLGALSPPGEPASPALDVLRARLKPRPRRAAELGDADPARPSTLWPALQLVSCWADGAAAPHAESMSKSFPGVRLQPKGLLATEAAVSVPLLGHDGAVPALTSHFLEFVEEGGGGKSRLVDEVEVGGSYEVVVTTGGGLYRYRLGDLVQVVGRHRRLPLIRFLGRKEGVSDLFGEKLTDPFVANVISRLRTAGGVADRFALLAPDREHDPPRYVLYAELDGAPWEAAVLNRLREELDEALCNSFHYAYCRRLGQLAAADVVPVGPNAAHAYLLASAAEGRRLGDVKLPALEPREERVRSLPRRPGTSRATSPVGPHDGGGVIPEHARHRR